MDYNRAREKNLQYIKYKESYIHNTALIASEGQKTIGVYEYEIKNIEEAEIINFRIFESCEEDIVFRGFIDEMIYWNPYLRRIVYHEEKNIIEPKTLISSGFIKNSAWIMKINNEIKKG